MAKTISVTVGPLAAAATNNIATSHTYGATSYIALDGTLGSATANSIALSQSVSGASLVKINGADAQTLPTVGATGAALPSQRRIYITSAGNDSGITFAVVGLDINSASVTETITGSNAGVAVSTKTYKSIVSITTSGSTASTITVGDFDSATLDTPRQVLITTASTTSFTISGTGWNGDVLSETVTNSGSSVASVLSYAKVSSILATSPTAAITVGTNQVADSQWIVFDEWNFDKVAVQCDVTGTVNYTVFITNDGFDGIVSPSTPSTVNWLSTLSPLVGVTVSAQGVMTTPCRGAKVTLNSETAATSSVTAKFTQYGNVPL